VQSKNWRVASLVYNTEPETNRNNGKKIKQTDERNKSKKQSESQKAVQGWGTSSLSWERLVKKVDFEPKVKKRKS